MKNINMIPAIPGTVGAIMSRQPLELSPRMRAREALARLRQVGVPQDFMSSCYVVDEEGRLLGALTLYELVAAPDCARLDQAMSAPRAVLTPEYDQEEAVRLMEAADCVELPVVDDEGKLVGTVTAEDAMEVLRDEATEDMERMAAILPSERPYLKTSVWEIYKKRVLWLLLLMVSAAFTGAIITHYETALAAQVVLTAFIPMLMDTGGNCGSQASTMIIRGLALGEVQLSDVFKVVWKELRVGTLVGAVLAAVNFVQLLIRFPGQPLVCATVVVSLMATVILAKTIGCMLPMAAKVLHMDPAIMAAPLITTIVDALSLVIYFQLACALLGL